MQLVQHWQLPRRASQWGPAAAEEVAAEEKAAAEEEEAAVKEEAADGDSSSSSGDEMEDLDADFGQPHVVTTSVVPEAERKAAKAAGAVAEHLRQRTIREAGGVLAGDKLVFKHPADDTEVIGRRVL